MQTVTTLGLGERPLSQEFAPAAGPACEPISFQFKGRAGEYFRIWIVNTLLSVVTLGVYSAWAKVKRLRYFYGSTFLDGVHLPTTPPHWPSCGAAFLPTASSPSLRS